jgi:hypothetical protein
MYMCVRDLQSSGGMIMYQYAIHRPLACHHRHARASSADYVDPKDHNTMLTSLSASKTLISTSSTGAGGAVSASSAILLVC